MQTVDISKETSKQLYKTNFERLVNELHSKTCLKKMQRQYLLIYIIFITLVTCNAIPCDSCGNECANACGTKHFRTCCFNYLRKRSEVKSIKMVSNKKLTDYIVLQGRTMFTRNEMSSRHANIFLTSSNNSTNHRRPTTIYVYDNACKDNIANCIIY